jgi:hypothetical protein
MKSMRRHIQTCHIHVASKVSEYSHAAGAHLSCISDMALAILRDLRHIKGKTHVCTSSDTCNLLAKSLILLNIFVWAIFKKIR